MAFVKIGVIHKFSVKKDKKQVQFIHLLQFLYSSMPNNLKEKAKASLIRLQVLHGTYLNKMAGLQKQQISLLGAAVNSVGNDQIQNILNQLRHLT